MKEKRKFSNSQILDKKKKNIKVKKNMKKKIFMLLALLMTAATGAWAQNKNNDCADNCPAADKAVQASRVAAAGPRKVAAEFGEAELSFNCSTAGQYGVATDGEHIYTSKWNSNAFYKYDMDGNFIEEFSIPNGGSIRDMTYDGEYFYGVANGSTIYQMDFESKTLVGTIYTGTTMRGVTYDPERDGFWVVGNWSGPLALYDRDGNWIQNGIYAGSVSGIAYYEDEDGEEHILQSHNGNYYVYDYNITTNSLDGAVFNINNIPGYSGGSSGGAFIGEYNGQVCLFADVQQDPNLIGIVPIVNAKPVETGDCQWRYNEKTKTLTIYGNGAMADYDDAADCPWADFANLVETVIIKKGVTRIGSRAFHSMTNLTFVTIPSTMETIGDYAFYRCTELRFISIPASVTDLGYDAFWKCLRLRNIYMYADVNSLAWFDTDCDDFTLGTLAVCHVAGDAEPWLEKFDKKVNVNFKADLEEIPEEYANEGAFNISIGNNAHGTVTTYVNGDKSKKAEAGAAVMVTVKPKEGYIAERVYGTGYMRWEDAAARRATKTMDLIHELDIEKLKDNVWSFAMPGADVELGVVYRKLMTNGDITIDPIDDMQYTGETLKPEITVRDGSAVLVEGEDYEVEYTQTYAAGEAFLTVKGIGDYAGETTASFFIEQKSGDGLTVEVADAEAGEVPAITVKDGDMELFAEYDYDITFVDGDGNAVTEEQMAEGGTFKALIELKHNYTGSLSKEITVEAPEVTAIHGANKANEANKTYYTLSGRKVSKAVKGVYVRNGKKVVIK